jgi:hypothetical protein
MHPQDHTTPTAWIGIDVSNFAVSPALIVRNSLGYKLLSVNGSR